MKFDHQLAAQSPHLLALREALGPAAGAPRGPAPGHVEAEPPDAAGGGGRSLARAG